MTVQLEVTRLEVHQLLRPPPQHILLIVRSRLKFQPASRSSSWPNPPSLFPASRLQD